MQRHQPIGMADFAWEEEAASPYESYAPEPQAPLNDYDPDEEVSDDDGDDGDDFSLEAEFDGAEGLFDQETGGTDGPGLSAVARHQIARGLDMPPRTEPWRSGIYGLVVHATGRGKMWQRAVEAGRSPLPELMAYYNRRNGPGYINGWGGVEAGDLVQMADERVETARGVGMGPQRKSVRSGNWERDVPDILVRKWRARWPGMNTPLDLLPRVAGSSMRAHPNHAYFHVECIPCPSSRHGLAEPMRPGMLYTKAQHDAIAALAVDIARRHRWPADSAWWRTPRLVGHEDLTPISRSNRRGGWDPGYLKEPMWFDFDYVHQQIERLWGARSGSGLTNFWGRITDAASGIGDAVSGVLERGEALLAVRRAMAGGEQDENKLTNVAFFALHPERQGRKIARHERALAREWIELRNTVVRPALRSSDEVEAAYEHSATPFIGESDEWADEAWAEDPKGEAWTEDPEAWEDETPEDFDLTERELQGDLDADWDEDPDEVEALVEDETAPAVDDYNRALEHALKSFKPDPDNFGLPWNRHPTLDWQAGKDPFPDGFYRDKLGKLLKHRPWGVLKLRSGREPYAALMSIIDHPDQWSFECATYVQAVHLYALASSRGRDQTNAFFANTQLYLRFHRSPGLKTLRSYRKNTRGGPWIERKGGVRREVTTGDGVLLSGAPNGSRVMWHNVEGKGNWKNENTVKVAPDRYRGFPLFMDQTEGVKGWKIRMGLASHARPNTRAMLGRLAGATGMMVKNDPDLQALWQYTKRKVYLREVTVIGPNPRV